MGVRGAWRHSDRWSERFRQGSLSPVGVVWMDQYNGRHMLYWLIRGAKALEIRYSSILGVMLRCGSQDSLWSSTRCRRARCAIIAHRGYLRDFEAFSHSLAI